MSGLTNVKVFKINEAELPDSVSKLSVRMNDFTFSQNTTQKDKVNIEYLGQKYTLNSIDGILILNREV